MEVHGRKPTDGSHDNNHVVKQLVLLLTPLLLLLKPYCWCMQLVPRTTDDVLTTHARKGL
jgi:hypothetical protein